MSPTQVLIVMALSFIAVGTNAQSVQSEAVLENLEFSNEEGFPYEERQLYPAGTFVNERVRNNVANILTRISNSSISASSNVSSAAALLVRHIVSEGFNVGSIATYVPRLFFLDGPNQFIEILKLYRSNQIRVPNDVESSIDTLIVFTNSVRESGIGTNFYPLVEVFPNLFTGFEKFLQKFLHNVFNWLSPIPDSADLDDSIKNSSFRLGTTTTTRSSLNVSRQFD